MRLQHRIVETIPEDIEERTLYISLKYGTAVHLCICGCKNEVVTPLSPTDWRITFHSEGVSLFPSIGNWSFNCQSHYWIEKSNVRIAEKWSEMEILSNRVTDKVVKANHYKNRRPDSKHTTHWTHLLNKNVGVPFRKIIHALGIGLWRK